jgi:diguanylate cyclase
MISRSFRFRITLIFGALTLLVVAGLSAALGSVLAAQGLRERGEALQGISNGVALMLGEGLRERRREVELMAMSSEAHRIGLDPQAWQSEIKRLRQGRPYYAWIGVTDAKGTVVSALDSILLGKDVSQRPWFQGAIKGTYVGDVHTAKLLSQVLPAPADGEPLRFIDFAAPLMAGDSAVIGTLGVHADWRWAQAVIDKMRSPDAHNAEVLVYIIDRKGDVIHHPAGPVNDVKAPEWQSFMPDQNPDVSSPPRMVAWSDGSRYLIASAALPRSEGVPDLGWTVVTRQPEALALADVARARKLAIGSAMLASLAAMWLAWVVAGQFSRPLEFISQAAARIEAGDRQTAIPTSMRTTELKQLSTALSRMTQHLLLRENALRESNERLEMRVAERTEELARANAHLETLALHDALTGLHNRRSMDLLLEQAFTQHQRSMQSLGVLMADIDHFKRVNDTWGHATGDVVLKAVALCLQAQVRHSDVAARYGGEEFLIMLPDTSLDGINRIAEKIRAAVAALALAEVGQITVSLGGAMADLSQDTIESMVQHADAALYEAKRTGRNRVVVGPV